MSDALRECFERRKMPSVHRLLHIRVPRCATAAYASATAEVCAPVSIRVQTRPLPPLTSAHVAAASSARRRCSRCCYAPRYMKGPFAAPTACVCYARLREYRHHRLLRRRLVIVFMPRACLSAERRRTLTPMLRRLSPATPLTFAMKCADASRRCHRAVRHPAAQLIFPKLFRPRHAPQMHVAVLCACASVRVQAAALRRF